MKTVRVKMTVNKPEKTITLCDKIIEKHLLMGVDSPLNGIVDMTLFGNKLTTAKELRKQGGKRTDTKEKKYNEVLKKCGLAEGQTRDTEDTVYWFVQKVRNFLLSKFKGSEESLTPYGFNVVISQTGSRKNVRVDMPIKNPDGMITLAEDILEEHDDLGVDSPLTGNIELADMETVTDAARVLLSEWNAAKGEAQSLNNQALVILGYGEGQTSFTEGTLYFFMCIIRDRLLDVFQGIEESLSEWGFDVKIGHTRKIRRGTLIIIQGDINSAAIVNIVLPQIEPQPGLPVKFDATLGPLRFYASATPGEAPGPSTPFFDVQPGIPFIKTIEELMALLGMGDAKPHLNVQNIGMTTAHYKLTIG